jgi:uncharacterized protein YPO0396
LDNATIDCFWNNFCVGANFVCVSRAKRNAGLMAMIEKKPFTNYTLDEERVEVNSKVFSIRLNTREQAMLEEDMKILHQPKHTTALKTLAEIGHYVLHEPKTMHIIETVFKNKSNNDRTGNSIIE